VIEALIVSNLLLWVVVVALAATVVALVRQVGVLHERIAPAGAMVTRAGPTVGRPAPQMTLATLGGGTVELGTETSVSTLLFFVSPTCPLCKELLPVVERVAQGEDPTTRVVLASDGEPDEHRRFVAARGLERFPYVLSAELGLTYQVAKLPYAVLIDEHGTVRAKGLVNTREHLESLFEARRLGVESVQQYVAGHTEDGELAGAGSGS